MPAASCRSMPARSISRCDTISASFGVSFRMGKKKLDNRMGALKNRRDTGYPSETGLGAKIQGRYNITAETVGFLEVSLITGRRRGRRHAHLIWIGASR